MKIISGKYKGRNILGYNIKGTRPTMERVKESLFATIYDYLKDSTVLDLFSGSGNLAIEALSEGAKYACVVDNNIIAYKTIEKNINNLGITSNDIRVLKADYKDAIINFSKDNIKFDIIFLDPPYETDYIEKSLIYIEKYNILENSGIVICESNGLDKIIYSNSYKSLRSKKYGDKYIVILEKI